MSVRPSVRPSAWNKWAPTGRIFVKFDIWIPFENLWRKFQFHCYLTRITGTLREDQYSFLIRSRSGVLRMRNVPDKSCRENENIHFMLSNFFRNRAVYEIMWKNTVEPDRLQMTIWRMRIACWIPEATNTYSQYVIITAFPLQQWLHELPSILRYAYSTLSVCLSVCLSVLYSYMNISRIATWHTTT